MPAIFLGTPLSASRASIPSTQGRPDTPGLVDRFGRVARDLRVSITEKCSLRCTYCMPAEGLPAIPRRDLLTPDEIGRLVGLAWRELGVTEVRFTGGEPLLRNDLAEIFARSAEAAPGIGIAMTRVNVSLDTVNREHFASLTRRDRLDSVFAGIHAAHAAGIAPLKINAVLMRETLVGAADLLGWSIQND